MRQAYGTDLHRTTPTWTEQRDPTSTRDQANLRIGNGGAGFCDALERALFLRTMCNITPAIAGNASRPSLWLSLRDKAFGADLLQLDTEGGGWTHFLPQGGPLQRSWPRR